MRERVSRFAVRTSCAVTFNYVIHCLYFLRFVVVDTRSLITVSLLEHSDRLARSEFFRFHPSRWLTKKTFFFSFSEDADKEKIVRLVVALRGALVPSSTNGIAGKSRTPPPFFSLSLSSFYLDTHALD